MPQPWRIIKVTVVYRRKRRKTFMKLGRKQTETNQIRRVSA